MTNPMASYEYYKKRWDETKPIRGRAEVIKPIGQRRRIWETIEKRGLDTYACHLYQTDVVKYYADGSVGLCCGSWATPTTAEFMALHSPFNVYKRHSKLWVEVHGTEKKMVYPIPETGELRLFARVEGSQVVYEPKETITIKKSVVDRTKAKEARDKLSGFLNWAKTFNKLSDGWIAHDTREQFGTLKLDYWRADWDYGLPKDMMLGYWSRTEVNPPVAYEFLQTCDDDGYMRVYLAMFNGQNHNDSRKVKVMEGKNGDGKPSGHAVALCDYRYTWEQVKSKIYAIADKAVDIRKEIEVPVGSKAMTKVVG